MKPEKDLALKRILRRLPVIAAVLLLMTGYIVFGTEPRQEALPAAAAGKLTVVIDPGHGGEDCGAVGVSGVEEAGLNLQVSMLLKQELEERGMQAVLTRQDGNALAKGKKADMAARREIMNGPEVDLVVSIHMNKFTDGSVHGPMAFYMQGSAEGERLAKNVIDSVTDAIGAPRRIANPGDYYVIRESKPVAVLVECGFLSNAEDERLLQSQEHQQLIAQGVAKGIEQYLQSANMLD